MESFIDFAGKFTRPETHQQITQSYFFTLTISGFEYCRRYTPQGKLICDIQENNLSLLPPGSRVEFASNEKRENYVIICRLPELHWNEEEMNSEYNYNGGTVKFAATRQLDVSGVLQLRRRFARVVELQQSALPADLCTAEMMLGAMLTEMLLLPEKTHPPLPHHGDQLAAALKELIDRDEEFKYNISEHCAKLHYSIGYCRKSFVSVFGIDPGEYRLRRRLEKVRYLLACSDCSHKQVADMVGMKNVTHLHAFVRQRCGTTLAGLSQVIPK